MTQAHGGPCAAVARLVSSAEAPGFDPYDGLSGTRIPEAMLGNSRTRQVIVQVCKRSPWRLETVFSVAPRHFAKADGAMLTAVSRCQHAGGMHVAVASAGIVARLDAADLARSGSGGWGYEFDVQTRWAFYPAGSANLIATFFIGRGFALDGLVRCDPASDERFTDACAFLVDRLFRAGEAPFFAYTLMSDTLVHNANLLGAGLVAVAGAKLGRDEWVRAGLAAALTTVAAQEEDGSWAYGAGKGLEWSDNFHTAYNLDGLLLVWLATGDAVVRAALDRGVEHWVQDFFEPDGAPRYYPGKPYPYDIHSAGTAVDVAARLATWGWDTAPLAERVAAWTERNLVDQLSGLTYFQKHGFWTDKRHFVRWGDAHWALGLSSLALTRAGTRDPLEAAAARESGVLRDAR